MYLSFLAIVLSSGLYSVQANQNFLDSDACDIAPWETSSWKENVVMDSMNSELTSQQEQRKECFVTSYNGNITLLSEPWYLFQLHDVTQRFMTGQRHHFAYGDSPHIGKGSRSNFGIALRFSAGKCQIGTRGQKQSGPACPTPARHFFNAATVLQRTSPSSRPAPRA